MSLKKLSLVVLAGLLAASLSGCGGSGSGGGGAKTPKDTLVLGTAFESATLDPAVSMDNGSWAISYPCYDRLVKYKTVGDKASSEVEASLAESWQASPDGLVWTFKLKKDAKFPDGTPVDAKAVKFSFDRLLKMKKGPSDYFPTLKTVDAVDATTVKFTLSKPFAPFLYTLATSGASIINPKVMEKAKGDDNATGYLAEHTMGSGAYQLSEWARGQHVTLAANDKYWGKKPALKKVIFQVIKDASAQRLQLEKGDLDMAEGIPVEQMDELAKNKDIKIGEYPTFLVSYLYVNNQKAPLNNVKVRQALSYAMDYKAIIDGSVKGKGVPMKGPIPKGMWGYDESLAGYTTNVEKAKQLLAESGQKDLTVHLLYSNYKTFWEAEALLIQNSLQTAGIKCELDKVAWATLRERVDKGNFEICLGSWSPDFSDPYMFMNCWYDSKMFGLSGDRSFYKNPTVDQLLRQAVEVTDQKQRTELYQKAQKIVVDEAGYILLFQTSTIVPQRANVKGFVYNPMTDGQYNFEDMSKS